MNSVFNTTFEVSLRVLIALSVNENPKSVDMLAAMDFLSVYGKNFGITEANLHGDNSYKYGEFSNRRIMIKKAIRSLILKEMVDVYEKDDGYYYSINDVGEAFCDSLTSEYAADYAQAAKAASAYMAAKSEREVVKEIISKSTADLRTGGSM